MKKEPSVRPLSKSGLPTLKIKSGTRARFPEDIATLARPIADAEQEFVVVFNLKASYEVTSATVVAIGDRAGTICPTCNIFKAAIIDGAAGIVIVHNHPSGSLKLSKLDKKSVKEWMKAGLLLEIAIIDAMVVTKDAWRSYGWLKSKGGGKRR